MQGIGLFSDFCGYNAAVNNRGRGLLHTREEYIPEGETAASKSCAFAMLSRTTKQSVTSYK